MPSAVTAQEYEIVIRFSTEVTPGADHAARSASAFSAQERTVPFKITLLPCTSTVIRCASVWALRTSACSIFSLSSDGVRRGLTVDESWSLP